MQQTCSQSDEDEITGREKGCLSYLALAEMTQGQKVESEQDDGTVRIYTVKFLRRSLRAIRHERKALGLAPLPEQPPLVLYPPGEVSDDA